MDKIPPTRTEFRLRNSLITAISGLGGLNFFSFFSHRKQNPNRPISMFAWLNWRNPRRASEFFCSDELVGEFWRESRPSGFPLRFLRSSLLLFSGDSWLEVELSLLLEVTMNHFSIFCGPTKLWVWALIFLFLFFWGFSCLWGVLFCWCRKSSRVISRVSESETEPESNKDEVLSWFYVLFRCEAVYK